ncbi:glycosyltransferase family 39 protein [Actinopolyspora sp. BKK1]|uniref:glycosyltransferase family 39 protein n=1 Tax=unclassified Actinopolyspora TaxID=2639451 RepID=UPI00325C037A
MSTFLAGRTDGLDRAESERAETPAFARGPVLALGCATGALLLLLSGRYGYLSDELYFLAAGKYYPDWGYMDQQPLVPLLARWVDAAFPGSLVALRVLPALLTVLGVLVTALIAREFGGDRRAQTLAAAAYVLSPWLLLSGHWLAAATLAPPEWGLVLWLVLRWTRLHRLGIRRDRLLFAAAALVAVGVQTKFQMLVLCAVLLLAVLGRGPRELLRRPALWAGGALVAVTAAPTLVWQHRNGWPALDMGTVVASETNRLLFVPNALLFSGVVVGAVLCCYGFWRLLRGPEFGEYRYLGWTVLGVVGFYLVASGRPNYPAGVFGLLFAAAAVGLQHRRAARRAARFRWVAWVAYPASALLPLALLPVYPLSLLAERPGVVNYSRMYETGWPELARTAAAAYDRLPAELRADTVVVGSTYPIAAALDVHGRELGLPRAYSPHRGYWFFGAPPDSARAMIYVGGRDPLTRHFHERRRMATVPSDHGVVNIARGVPVTLYAEPDAPWSELWPRVRRL